MSADRAEKPPSVSGPLFVPTMHGIRGLAVLVVVMYHVGGAAIWTPVHGFPRAMYEASGPIAVDVLFFTTGFVLFLPVVLKGRFGSAGAFAIRRFARIGPPYYVCMLIVAVAFPLLSTPAIADASHRGFSDFLIHLGFLQRVLSPGNVGFIVNSPVWSMSIDVAFYVLLPFIAATYLRHPLAGLAIALVAATAWRVAFIEPHPTASSYHTLEWLIQPPLFLADFASGMTAAWAFVRLRQRDWPRINARTTVAVAGGALATLLGLAYLAGSNLPYHLGVFQEPAAVRVLFPLTLLVFAVAAALAPPRAQWPLTNRPLLWFSEISYSVFLYHFPIIFFGFFTIGISRDGGFPWLWTLAVLPTAIAIGTISYVLIERPSRRYGRRLAKRIARGDGAPIASAGRTRAAALGLKDSGHL